jgi:hypothetical protein
MTPTELFLICLGVGAALIAFWLVVRFPDRGPGDIRRALLHVGIALAAGWWAPDLLTAFIAQGYTAVLIAVFLIIFPVLVYTFVAGAWLLKLAHDSINHRRY